MNDNIIDYAYHNALLNCSHGYLLPAVTKILEDLHLSPDNQRLFELGCGNGSVANHLTEKGWDVTGVDPSRQGIALANRNYPNLKLFEGSAYDDLTAVYGQFPVVVSLEVVEHVYSPRKFAATLYSLVQGGGCDYFNTLSWLLEESGYGADG